MFVLRELALLDLGFPAGAIALGPLAAAHFGDRRLAVPGQPVGLALVLALLVDHDLVALSASVESDSKRKRAQNEESPLHERAPLGFCCCCGGETGSAGTSGTAGSTGAG